MVTGAASGIGAALTTALVERGLDVVAIDRHTADIDPRADRFAVDVRDEAAMAAVAERFAGRAAAMVFANAGIGGIGGDAPDLPDAAWQWAWEVNTLGVLRTLRLWWPHLCAGRGQAVATLSAAALQSFPGAGPYRASKAALLAALEGLHYRAQAHGVSVHAMCPGLVRTQIVDVGRYDEAAHPTPGAALAGNPFAAHLAEAMQHAEPAAQFAQRVLRELEAGAPFYWLTHGETRDWIEARHHAIEQGHPPFSDFAGTGPRVRRTVEAA
ncbi:SDR family oxidoreductase [Rubrivivax sp. RP6-9]|uniref:SDR family oxidoreductase n=1 Tax=Rubrivivax sp. RP6-9 TaxID=3415750 RepID=UPI003CC5BC58